MAYPRFSSVADSLRTVLGCFSRHSAGSSVGSFVGSSAWPAVVVGMALALTACPSVKLPDPPPECTVDGVGCLPDEICVEGKCQLREKCGGDEDCPSEAWQCVFPAQLCELRPGFGEECSDAAPCEPGNFCALGLCRPLATARPCAKRGDCPIGQGCDRESFYCIDEGACTLSESFPELACDPDEECDALSERCRLRNQGECTTATEQQDCGVGQRCDGAGRCVQCIINTDCGAGLVCNIRAGRCESENLCFSDDDCEKPLVCDARTALCQVPPPPCESDLDCNIAEICNRATGICELPGGACDDDRLEESDTPAGADVLSPSRAGEATIIDDLRLCPDDDDVYAVQLRAGEELVAQVLNSTPQARATVWLLDGDGEISLRFAETPPRGNGTIVYRADVDEEVYLRINALVGQTPYDLALEARSATPCTPDAFEGDLGNNSLATATPASLLPLASSLEAALCNGDVDFYAVDVKAGEIIDVSVLFDSTLADLDVAVVDPDTGAIFAQSAGLSPNERVRVRAPSDRTFVVKVSGFGGAAAPYSLSVDKVPPFVCNSDDNELLGDNDPATAPEAILDIQNAERTVCLNDVDYVRIPLLDFQQLVVRNDFAPSDVRVALDILDETGTTVLAAGLDNAAGSIASYRAQGNETVLIRSQSLFGSSGSYRLSIERSNQVDCAPDVSEPNNNSSIATALPASGQLLTLCGTDQDFFAVEGVAGKKLHVRAAFAASDGDLDLMLIGIDGRQILATSDGIESEEEMTVLLPLDGIYSIRVFSLGNSARSRYTLDAELLSE